MQSHQMYKFLLSAVIFVAAVAAQKTPIVVWHGMGDSCCDERSIAKVAESIDERLGGDARIFSYEVGAGGISADSKASFFGNLNVQVQLFAQELAGSGDGVASRVIDLKTRQPITAEDVQLLQAEGFNAIGFSQGGQALRAYVERYNEPRVRALITFGSQHAGVAAIPNCAAMSDSAVDGAWYCSLARAAIKRGVYTDYVQQNLVQAQYFKDRAQLDKYREHNIFLPDVNNEVAVNEAYRENMQQLEHLVLIKFTKDTMVAPKESAWFQFYVDAKSSDIQPLNESPMYESLGLRELHESSRLHLLEVDGNHLQFSLQWLHEHITDEYLRDSTERLVIQA